MRTAAGLVLMAAFAAAFTFSPEAGPRLSVEHTTYQMGEPGRLLSVRLTLTPPLVRGRDHVISCHNEHFDRSKLQTDGGCREQNLNGTGVEDGQASLDASLAGHYEAVAQRLSIDDQGNVARQVSNVVSFDVFDLCGFVVDVAPGPPTLTMLPGAPVACSGSGSGRAAFHASDGTKLKITSGAMFWTYDTSTINAPLLRLNGQGKKAAVEYRSGRRLGRIAAQIAVPAVALYSPGPVDLSVTHANGVATVRVHRGTVVGFRVSGFESSLLVRKACRGRPTLRCLSRVHYTVGGLKRREEHGKVVRAGRTARFTYRGRR